MSSNRSLLPLDEPADAHPLDIVEKYIETHGLDSHRRCDDELDIQCRGAWCDYSISFAWNEEIGAIYFSCAFDIRVQPEQRFPINDLLALINEKLWCGHFGVWTDGELLMFRHTMLMSGTSGPTYEQIENLIDVAIVECERFYPAFQYVIWSDMDAQKALVAAMIDTVGEA